MIRKLAVLIPVLAALTISGCSNTFKPTGKTSDQEVFERKGCPRCHTTEGPTEVRTLIDLTKIGDRRPESYLRKWLGDPRSVDREATMPAPELSEEERSAIVDYLVTLR